jgi:hypothetical protein
MSPILFGGSENRDESGCHRPVEENVCKAVCSKHPLRAYDDCYHRAIQRALILEHRKRKDLLIRGGFGVIIRHIEGDDVGDGITEGVNSVDTGWRRHEKTIGVQRTFLKRLTLQTIRHLRHSKWICLVQLPHSHMPFHRVKDDPALLGSAKMCIAG